MVGHKTAGVWCRRGQRWASWSQSMVEDLLSSKRSLLQADEWSRTSSFGIHTVLWQWRWMHLYLRYGTFRQIIGFWVHTSVWLKLETQCPHHIGWEIEVGNCLLVTILKIANEALERAGWARYACWSHLFYGSKP